jgi:aryl-alcohol dehydrogenase-like predicted oxidoreductase
MATEHFQGPDMTRIDRRRFLRLGVAASGVAIGCGASENGEAESTGPVEMRYRPLGNTGLQVSEVSFGSASAGFDNPGLLLAALDAGINTISTSDSAAYGLSEELIGDAIRAIGSDRDRMVLLTGSEIRPGTTKQSILDGIDRSLRRLRTDRVEIYCTGNVGWPDDLRIEATFEAFEEAKQAGKVLHLGLSGHRGGMQDCLNAAIDDGRFEVFFTKYDFISYPDQDQILRRAADRGIGTIVFKTNAGNRQQEVRDLEAGGLSFRQATVKWALTNPDVTSVCVGITNFDQIREYTAAVGRQMNGAEAAMLRRYAREMHDQYCRFCGVCEANCPHDVAIAEVMRYAMYFKYYGREKRSMQLYDALPRRCMASMCDGCSGPCEAGCPFGRRVRAELTEAHRLLSMSSA